MRTAKGHWTRTLSLGAVGLLMTACGSGDAGGAGTDPVCVPGQVVSCPCAGGGSGTQKCAADGSGLSECACTGPSDTGSPPPDTYVADTYVADTYVADTGSGDTGSGDTMMADAAPVDAGPSVAVKWTYPGFHKNGTSTLFPTYLARLYDPAPKPLVPLSFTMACADVTNSGASSQSVELTAAFPSFATPRTVSVTVPGGGTSTQCFNPSFTWTALGSLTTLTPGTLQVSAAIAGGGAALGTSSFTFQAMEANGINWTVQSGATQHDMHLLSTVFVRPNDPTVITLRSEAEKLSGYGGSFGTAPFSYDAKGSASVAVGARNANLTFFESGETVTIDLTSVSGGTSNDINFYLLDDANYALYAAGKASTAAIVVTGATTGMSRTFTAPADGWYYFVLYNPTTNFVSRSVSWRRDTTYFDAAYDVAQATFSAIRARGVSYSNLTSSGLSGIQDVRAPSKVLSDKAGNCLEGSFLFASVFEQVGFQPQLHMLRCPDIGHAIVGVRPPGARLYWPIETTMVGGTATSWDAMMTALKTVNDHLSCTDAFPVAEARSKKITPGE